MRPQTESRAVPSGHSLCLPVCTTVPNCLVGTWHTCGNTPAYRIANNPVALREYPRNHAETMPNGAFPALKERSF
jgi:hypothetical protein